MVIGFCKGATSKLQKLKAVTKKDSLSISQFEITSISFSTDNEEDVSCAITYGADGYLLKDMDPEQILEKLKEAAIGRMVISEKLTHVLAGAIRGGETSTKTNLLAKLTSREHETLKLIAKGMSNKLIARELDISDGTVKVHVKHILKKLALNSRVEAAVWMVNNAA